MIEGHQVLADRGAVSAQQPAAARIGAQILAQGGNAMDAAAATSFACCMLAPQSNGIGGYMSAAVVLGRFHWPRLVTRRQCRGSGRGPRTHVRHSTGPPRQYVHQRKGIRL